MSERPINAQPAAPISHIEVSTPLWRLVSVIAACGAVAAFAYYLNAIHHADDVATVVVVTAGYTISFWARKRPDMMARRFGVFGRIATAIRNSQDNLRKWVRQATARRHSSRQATESPS